MDDLIAELGLTEVLARSSEDQREALVTRVQTLREERRVELRAAIDRALEQVPWLLRAALKKVLFP